MKKTKYYYAYYNEENNEYLLVHTFIFTTQLLSNKEYKYFLEDKLNNLPKHLIEILFDKGFIEFETSQRFSRLRKIVIKKNRAPVYYIYITNDCNFKCSFCFQLNDRKVNNEREITYDDLRLILRDIESRWNDSVGGSLILFGGEPLLRANKKKVAYLLNEIESLNLSKCDVQIITNGFYLDHYINTLKLYSNLISTIRTTFNGDSYGHNTVKPNSYEKIRENIILASKELPFQQILVNYLVDKNTIKQLDCFRKENQSMFNLKNVKLTIGRVQDRTCENEPISNILPENYLENLLSVVKQSDVLCENDIMGGEFEILNKAYLKLFTDSATMLSGNLGGCQAVKSEKLTYHPDGNIYFCSDAVGLEKFSIGNYRENETYEDNIKDLLKIPEYITFKCSDCKFIGICNGGCPVKNYHIYQRLNQILCYKVEEGLESFGRLVYNYLKETRNDSKIR